MFVALHIACCLVTNFATIYGHCCDTLVTPVTYHSYNNPSCPHSSAYTPTLHDRVLFANRHNRGGVLHDSKASLPLLSNCPRKQDYEPASNISPDSCELHSALFSDVFPQSKALNRPINKPGLCPILPYLQYAMPSNDS